MTHEMIRTEQLDYIRAHTSKAALCELLAEEASELSQAALKLARILRGEVPTPRSEEKAQENLIEEYADVHNAADVLKLYANYPIMQYKLNRWSGRLMAREEQNE